MPYGTIVPQASDRVWVVGRCFSATHDANASCRSMAQTMAMGQAAGLAAGLSLDTDTAAHALPVARLQQLLEQTGAILDLPQALADTSRQGWINNFPAGKAPITYL